MNRTACLLVLLILLAASCAPPGDRWNMESPGGILKAELVLGSGEDAGTLSYRVLRDGSSGWKEIVYPSPLGIERDDADFARSLEFVSAERAEGITDSYRLVTGKQREVNSTFNRMEITFRNATGGEMTVAFRVYDGGVAFRYGFPGMSDAEVRVSRELTGFHFPEGNFWAHPYDTVTKWNPAYETYYEGPMEVGTPAPWNKNGWAFPLLVEAEGCWMLASESGFDGSYGASHLEPRCDGGLYRIRFAEPDEAEGYYEHTSHSPLPWELPWRFIAVGDSPDEIVTTSLPTDLADPSRVEDVSWIEPGRATWSWWSDSDSPQDYLRLVPFVDFAAKMGWEYSLVDANWNRMKNGSLEKLAGYAEEKGIGLLAWYNSGGKHNVVEEEPRDLMDQREARRAEFKRISDMGIRGIKVDFFQSDKQAIIGQYIGILEDAAEYNLLVNFHGCTLPRGWRRTWPHLMTMESVKGGECYRFDARFPEKAPSHIAILPFTRNAVGPCDYTPGGFSDSQYPHLTTYGFELALPVVIESGLMHHMDTPERTMSLNPAAVEFLKEIPVVWDETVWLAGYPGKDVVIARRSGDRWFVGGINGEATEKELTFDLSATGSSPESLRIITDGDAPRMLREIGVRPDQGSVTLRLGPYGGFTGTW